MRKQTLFGAITTVTVLGSVFAFSLNPANAQQYRCPLVRETPASENRQIEIPEFRFKFQIPANYRTEKRKDYPDDEGLYINIYNPGVFAAIKCCIRGKGRGCGEGGIEDISISIRSTTSKSYTSSHLGLDLTDTIPKSTTYTKTFNIKRTTIANQDAIIFFREDGPKMDYVIAHFFTPDKRYLITLMQYIGYNGNLSKDYQQKKPIFQQVVSTFEFN